jgi:CheY-like chemotaxis protein
LGTPAILVIDNDRVFHDALARALGSVADTELVTHGAEALRLLARKKFSVILLDVNVRVIDGFVILRTMAGRPGPNKDTPVYVLTDDASEHTRVRALREHAVFVLAKPASPATVATLIEATLRKPSLPPPAEARSSGPPSVPPSVPPPPISGKPGA